MSTTTTINPTGTSNTSGKKNLAAQAATITGAAAVGAAATAATISSGILDDSENVSEVQETVESQSENETVTADSDTSNATTQTTSQTQETTVPNNSVNDVVEELEPITETPNASEVVYNEGHVDSENQVEEVTEVHEDVETSEGDNVTETVNPDDIAQAIISEDQVDPNDIDMEDVINFDEIGTVYTVTGEAYAAASFHDASGNHLAMVDIDGDEVFDLVTDLNGNVIAEVPGTITVDDAEINIVDDGTYLAHNDSEIDTQFGSDSIAQDMIS